MENNEIKENKKNNIIIISLIVIIVLLICLIAYLLLKDNKVANNNNTNNNVTNNVVNNNQTNDNTTNNVTNHVVPNNQTNSILGKTINELKTSYDISEISETSDKLVYLLKKGSTSDNDSIFLFNKSDKKLTHIFSDCNYFDEMNIGNKKFYTVGINKMMQHMHPMLSALLDNKYNTVLSYNSVIQRFKAEDTVDTTFGTKGKLWNPTIYNNTLLFRSLPSKSDDSINLYQFDLNGNFLKTINIGEGEDYNNDKIYLKKENNDYKIYKYDGTYLNNLLNLKDDMYFIAFNYYDYKYTIYDMNATNEATITANIYQGSVENNKPNITNESKCFTYSYNLNTNKIDVKTVACSKFDFSSSKDANILTKKCLHQ